jgi:hypothetical protein
MNSKIDKMDLRTRRTAYQAPVVLQFTLKDIANACGISIQQVIVEKHRGYFDPDDLRSVAMYIAKRILFKVFK